MASSSAEDRQETLSSGLFKITIFATKEGMAQLAGLPTYGGFSDSMERIRHAINKKRSQVRGAGAPVILAISASGISSSFENFDRVLFGDQTSFAGQEGEVLYDRFVAKGEFASSRSESPTIAGVLGFVEVCFACHRDPVLWIHPRFRGYLPSALMSLEVRQMAPSTIPSRVPGVLGRLPNGEARFYRPDGRLLAPAPALPVVTGEPVTALVSRLAGQGVAVDAGETVPSWWGGPVDYAWEIDWLRSRDRHDPASATG